MDRNPTQEQFTESSNFNEVNTSKRASKPRAGYDLAEHNSASTSSTRAPGSVYIPQNTFQATEYLFPGFPSPISTSYWPQPTTPTVAGAPQPYYSPRATWSTHELYEAPINAPGLIPSQRFGVESEHPSGYGQTNAPGQEVDRPDREIVSMPSSGVNIFPEIGPWALDSSSDSISRTGRPGSGLLSQSSESHIQRREDDNPGSQVTASYSDSNTVDHSFLRQSFPLDNEDHKKMRDALNVVMTSNWKRNNSFEPDSAALLQFMTRDDVEGRWYCLFWKDGKNCQCSCRKKYHAKGHIRSHIDLLPFVCSTACPISSTGCMKRYPAVEPLQKHRKGKATCDVCGMSLLPGNMKRHSLTCQGRPAS